VDLLDAAHHGKEVLQLQLPELLQLLHSAAIAHQPSSSHQTTGSLTAHTTIQLLLAPLQPTPRLHCSELLAQATQTAWNPATKLASPTHGVTQPQHGQQAPEAQDHIAKPSTQLQLETYTLKRQTHG
jgi:hypothetical protein